MNFIPGVFSKTVSSNATNRLIANNEDNHPTNRTNAITTKKPKPGILIILPLTSLCTKSGATFLIMLGKISSTTLNKLITTQIVIPIGANTIKPWKKYWSKRFNKDLKVIMPARYSNKCSWASLPLIQDI